MPYYHGPTDDPLRDAVNYDRDRAAWERTLPVCLWCGERFVPDPLYDETWCPDCRAEMEDDDDTV